MRYISLFLRWALGGLFVYAGAQKAVDPTVFAVDIHHYRLLPVSAVTALALYLPYLEIFAGLGALTKRFRAGALLVLAALILIFMAALAAAWMRGLDIRCGCFGASDSIANYPRLMLRNLSLFALTLFLWFKSELPLM